MGFLAAVKAAKSSSAAAPSRSIRPRLERIGAWDTQGRLMLGHIRPNVSDKYATPYHEAYLVDAVRLIEELIDRIEAAAPGAFSLD
ncbi:hypothetical protein PF049_02705 [Erythrobacteraceae bacterium WH01K]|nr:hypothetical protein PF049_02705 [Erythrobacteraceae bacterium WH01K]